MRNLKFDSDGFYEILSEQDTSLIRIINDDYLVN